MTKAERLAEIKKDAQRIVDSTAHEARYLTTIARCVKELAEIVEEG